jgi:hypothetical protein
VEEYILVLLSETLTDMDVYLFVESRFDIAIRLESIRIYMSLCRSRESLEGHHLSSREDVKSKSVVVRGLQILISTWPCTSLYKCADEAISSILYDS